MLFRCVCDGVVRVVVLRCGLLGFVDIHLIRAFIHLAFITFLWVVSLVIVVHCSLVFGFYLLHNFFFLLLPPLLLFLFIFFIVVAIIIIPGHLRQQSCNLLWR